MRIGMMEEFETTGLSDLAVERLDWPNSSGQ